MKEFVHMFSDGVLTPDLFVTESDYVAALNLLAVLSNEYDVSILGYGFEDTHVHILAKGIFENCDRMRAEYQRMIRRILQYSSCFSLEMEPVLDESYLKNVGAYVICQSTKDGKRIMQYDNKWSSASLYFRSGMNDLLWRMTADGEMKAVLHMSQIKVCQRRQMFHTRRHLPLSWDVCDGLILPSSFVNVQGFESIYCTHNAFRTFCGGSRKSDILILDSMAEHYGVNMEEDEARYACKRTCLDMFGFSDIRRLTIPQRIQLARDLRKVFHMSYPQLARRVHLPEMEIRRYVR